jgi:glycoprotein-N-acetylgalactosamine 3-beta-galactosyltransferase
MANIAANIQVKSSSIIRRRPTTHRFKVPKNLFKCFVTVAFLLSISGVTRSPIDTVSTIQSPYLMDTPSLLDIMVSACHQDFHDHKKVLDFIQIAKPLPNPPKILCFIMTHSGNHATRIQSVLNTWGRKCDKLVLASNTTDASIVGADVVQMQSKATWKHLWSKLQETLVYISTHYHEEYDWFLKIDDDTYLIFENLQAYLESLPPSINTKEQPLLLGRLFGLTLPQLKDGLKSDRTFFQQLKRKYALDPSNFTFVFPSGGAGYVMNRAYLQVLVDTFKEDTVLQGTPPEDVALAATTLYSHQVQLQGTTRDESGRQRFHFNTPHDMYHAENMAPWVSRHHNATGGIVGGRECCSSNSVTFHYIDRTPGLMEYIHQQLYTCRMTQP